MTDTAKLSARALKAIKILAAGGQFYESLSGKFDHRLQTSEGNTVSRIGVLTFYELYDKGFLSISRSTSVYCYYRLSTAA